MVGHSATGPITVISTAAPLPISLTVHIAYRVVESLNNKELIYVFLRKSIKVKRIPLLYTVLCRSTTYLFAIDSRCFSLEILLYT